MLPPPPRSTLFPYTTLFRSLHNHLSQSLPTGMITIKYHGRCHMSTIIWKAGMQYHEKLLLLLKHIIGENILLVMGKHKSRSLELYMLTEMVNQTATQMVLWLVME